MKIRILSFLLATTLASPVLAQNKPAYRIFTGEGKKAHYHDIIKGALKADVVFFGELHDNPIAHWLELQVTKDLFDKKGKDLVLAAEMFERDNQLMIDEYFGDLIKEASFESEVRKWNNYSTDYKPLLKFAKDNGLRFVASNIPRRYAAMVASEGFEALNKVSPEGKKYIAPLPIEYDPGLPCYKDMLSMGGGAMGHSGENLPKAQAIKDATMAKSISDNWQKGKEVIHFNGSYHSDRHQGIIWYLNKYNPSAQVFTITTVLQDNLEKLDSANLHQADFVIVVPSDMTRTY
ncbi:MAG TPA: ChaN family lipoprotein [Bacteroidales bacterium]|nr:ChaN family lipoprotein [Bacteroidales bacterium]